MPKRPLPSSVVPSPSAQLAELIRTSGRTPAALAADAGIAPSMLSRFLSGERGLASWTIDRLATALGGVRLEAIRRPGRGKPRAAARGTDPVPAMSAANQELEGDRDEE